MFKGIGSIGRNFVYAFFTVVVIKYYRFVVLDVVDLFDILEFRSFIVVI